MPKKLAIWCVLFVLDLTIALGVESPNSTHDGNSYFPPPESAGGWRTLDKAEDIRRLAGADPEKLTALKEWLLQSDDRNFAAVVIRRGYIALEVERGNS